MRELAWILLIPALFCFGAGFSPSLQAATPRGNTAPNLRDDDNTGRASGKANDGEQASRRQRILAERRRELDRLFAQLMNTRDENLGRNIVNAIWMAWHRSGDRKVDDLISLATIYMGEGEYAAALPKLNEAIRRAPDNSESWNRRATLLFHMGEFDRSLADIAQTLKLEPRHFGALAGRGLIYAARGQYARALRSFEQALKINPFLKERFNLIPILRKKLGQQKI